MRFLLFANAVAVAGRRHNHALLDELVDDLNGHVEEAARIRAEIEHQTGRLRRVLDEIGDARPEPEDLIELRRLLYGLYAVLRLHNAQEEEGAFSLVPESTLTQPAAAH